MKEGYKNAMLLASFFYNFFSAAAFPAFNKNIIPYLDEKLLSAATFFICFFNILSSKIWNKYSNFLIKWYIGLLLTEVLFSFFSMLFLFFFENYKVYYILDIIGSCLISQNIICGDTKIKSLFFNGEKREKYDNETNIFTNLGILIGCIVSFFLGKTLNIKKSVILLFLSCFLGNGIYFILYIYCKRRGKQ